MTIEIMLGHNLEISYLTKVILMLLEAFLYLNVTGNNSASGAALGGMLL